MKCQDPNSQANQEPLGCFSGEEVHVVELVDVEAPGLAVGAEVQE